MGRAPQWAAEALNISYIIFLPDIPCGSILQANWEEVGVTTPPKPGSHGTFLHSIFPLSCEFSCLYLKFCSLKQDHLLTFHTPFRCTRQRNQGSNAWCTPDVHPLSFKSYTLPLSLGIVFEISHSVPVLMTKISPSER